MHEASCNAFAEALTTCVGAGHDASVGGSSAGGAGALPDMLRPWRQQVEELQERVLLQQEEAAAERAAWAQQLSEMQQQFVQAAGLLTVRSTVLYLPAKDIEWREYLSQHR